MMGAGTGHGRQTYIDAMFNLGGAAATSLTAMNPGVATSGTDYMPKANGTLLEIYIAITPQAASSLAQSGYLTLSSTSFVPINTLTINFAGFGLATAPQLYGGQQAITKYTLGLPVKESQKITSSILYYYSPVTPYATVTGKFSVD